MKLPNPKRVSHTISRSKDVKSIPMTRKPKKKPRKPVRCATCGGSGRKF